MLQIVMVTRIMVYEGVIEVEFGKTPSVSDGIHEENPIRPLYVLLKGCPILEYQKYNYNQVMFEIWYLMLSTASFQE